MIKNQNYTICSLWLAKELERFGFECIGIGANKTKPGFNVFYFEDTEDFRNKLKQIRSNQNGKVSKSKNSKDR